MESTEDTTTQASATPSHRAAAPPAEQGHAVHASAGAPVAPLPPEQLPARKDVAASNDGTLILEPPSYIPGLSAAQEKALAALSEGKTAIEAAVLAGVSRMTIYRWQYTDRHFMKALNLCRQQIHDAFSRRLTMMNDKALSAISKLLDQGDFRAAKLIISFVESQHDARRDEMDARDHFSLEAIMSRYDDPQKRRTGKDAT